MNKDNLKSLIRDLEDVVFRLKSEIYGDPKSYLHNMDDRTVQIEDDDGEPN